MTLLILAFIAGVLTVLAPCVLPLLPVIIGSTVTSSREDKKRPYIIAASLAVSIIAFTLLLKVSVSLASIPQELWTWISGGLIFILGVITVFPALWERISAKLHLQSASNKMLSRGIKQRNSTWGAILIGSALGPVFSSCSPTYAFILASILPVSFGSGFISLVCYTIGLSAILLLLSIFGRKIISRLGWAIDPHGWFRRILGVVFVVLGLAIITGAEKKFETWLANHLPFDITKVEQAAFDRAIKPDTEMLLPETNSKSDILNGTSTPAPELKGLGAWINSDATTLGNLRGKVVLVDFWTYSCINCIRTLPYVEKWYETYKDQGFVVLGIHSPEFAFEHEEGNVRAAAKEYGLTYPIALDNNFATWTAFGNRYWPAHYLIDKNSNIRYTHFGEGEYATTEKAIQELLGEDKPLVTQDPQVSASSLTTPETYFGTARAQNYVGSPRLRVGDAVFESKNDLAKDQWTLGGSWRIAADSIMAGSDAATLTFRISAKDVYVVASSPGSNQKIKVLIDGKSSSHGTDVNSDGIVSVDRSRLYHIATFSEQKDATIELQVPKDVSLFTFTFGD